MHTHLSLSALICLYVYVSQYLCVYLPLPVYVLTSPSVSVDHYLSVHTLSLSLSALICMCENVNHCQCTYLYLYIYVLTSASGNQYLSEHSFPPL